MRGVAAEIAGLGEEIEPAPEDQLAELLALGILAIEIDGDGGDDGRDRPVESGQRLVGKRRHDDCRKHRDGNEDAPYALWQTGPTLIELPPLGARP